MTATAEPPRHVAKPAAVHSGKEAEITAALMDRARCDEGTVLTRLASRPAGLTEAEVAARVIEFGPNQIARTKRRSKLLLLYDNVKNPLIILLLVLSLISYLTGDLRAAIVVLVMVVLGVVLRFVQEMRADNAAARLQAMVSSTATVVRDGKETEIPLSGLVPGDVIRLGAGDMVPADVRLLTTRTCSSTSRRSPARRCRSRSGRALPRRRSRLRSSCRTSVFSARTWRVVPDRRWWCIPGSGPTSARSPPASAGSGSSPASTRGSTASPG